MADTQTTSSNTQDLNELLKQSPFGPLLDIKGADGKNLTIEDIFGNIDFPAGGIPLGTGGDPFAGDNFWNIFNGGVNPTNFIPNNPIAVGGGGNPFPGGNPMTGGGGNPFPGGNPMTGGGGNPFPGGNPMTGGGGNPFPGGFPGGNPGGFPGHNPSTPVPEPSSILGLVVIGVGIVATKFRQHGRRTARVFNK